MQGGREHSSDLTIERMFSNLFFVKHQNLFLSNSCILPIRSIKTLQITCIFRMFFVAWWAVPYQGICEVRSPQSGEGGICRGPTILFVVSDSELEAVNFKEDRPLAQLQSARYRCGRSGVRFPGRSNRHSVANDSPPLRRFFGAVLPRR